MAKIKVTRTVYPEKQDATNEPHVETCEYEMEFACSQGFLASMVDSDHYATIEYIDDAV